MASQDTTTKPTAPHPTDSPFLFAMIVASRKSGDRALERLARGWLADAGIHVTFSHDFDRLHGLRGPANAEGAGS